MDIQFFSRAVLSVVSIVRDLRRSTFDVRPSTFDQKGEPMSFARLPLAVCSLLLAFTLAACDGSTPTTESTAASAAATSAEAPAAESAAGIGQIVTASAAASEAASQAASAEASTEASAEAGTAASAEAGTAASGQASAAGGTAGQASAAASAAASVAPAAVGEGLQAVRSRGQLICGVNDQLPGFGSVGPDQQPVGFDIDLCKAVAAAVFGDPNAVQYRPLSTQERFTALQSREIDLLARNTTWTISRDTSVGLDFAPVTFFDGQGMLVRTADGIAGLEDMGGASICVQAGTTTEQNLADAFRALNLEFTPVVFEDANQTYAAYDAGQCDGVTSDKSQLASRRIGLQAPDEHVILDETISKEPLAPAVLQGDPQWADIVSWTVYGLMNAEEYGITQENVGSFANSEDPNIRRLLGIEGELGAGLGLDNDFMVDVITAVGNYGEIYNRHLGPDTPINIPRGQNALYRDGGLIYGIPFR